VSEPVPTLAVVIPMMNEEANVQPLVDEVCTALRGRLDFELIVVDDGSTDGTWAALEALRASVPELRPLRHRRNFGQSAGILSGVRAARAPWIATLDGDGQNDPADIPRLWALVAGDPATPRLIAGNRVRRRDTWLRRLSSRTANRVRQALLHDDCPDTGCGLKLFPRKAFLELPHFDHLHRFLPALAKRAGIEVVNVPVNHRPRSRGRSKYGVHNRLWVGLVDLAGVMWLQRRPCRPEWVESADG